MNWLVYHIVSGHAFFTGVVLVVIAAFSSTHPFPIFSRVTALSFLTGVIAIALSSTAIPYWLYAISTFVTVAWITMRHRKAWHRWTSYATVGIWCFAAVIEIPYHITPSLNPADDRRISVIGDSVTAGVGDEDTSERWTSILARERDLQIQDISHIGETAASALNRAKKEQITGSVVIVAIGGNDILGSTTAEQFENDLDALLAHLAAPHRQIVLFELPLPPFCYEYGRVQRVVAARHNVTLIPRRVFLSVIAGSDSTLDTIHLSQSGHQYMADCVWRLVKSAFEPSCSGDVQAPSQPTEQTPGSADMLDDL